MRQPCFQGRHQRGLTAIELMVTLAILAVLIGIAAPSMTRFIAQWRTSNAINALTGSLRVARTEAIARARPVVLCRIDADKPNTCQTSTGVNSRGLASGWIVFANNDLDKNSNFSPAAGDELLLRQEALAGMADITPNSAARFVFNPNGLSNNAVGINFDAVGFDRISTTPWARKGLCITKPGRIRYVADSSDCTASEGS